jgi:hypothetical protein
VNPLPAQFGLAYFEDWFVYGDDDSASGCHSVVACFFLIFYKGIPAGELGDVLDTIDNRDPDYLGRLIFDLSFFVWVGILLFNIITGVSNPRACLPPVRACGRPRPAAHDRHLRRAS